MDHNFYVVCVGQNFLHGSIFFTWVKIFCGGLNFCVSDFLGAVGGQGTFLKISQLALSLLVLREF